MTTSTHNEVMDIEQTEDEVVEPEVVRSINELIDLPYSEMSEAEIELVIQFKADIQTRDNLYNAQMQMISETLQQAAKAHLDLANQASATLNELTTHAINRFNEATNEQAE